jgi:hypothetical protein
MAAPLRAPRPAGQPDLEQRLRRLRRRFARVTRPLERADRIRRCRRAATRVAPPLAVVALIAGAGLAAPVWTSPWPPGLTLRHLASGPNCPMARAVGLAPARRGQPGYWPGHDAARDGWSCEPIPR